MSKLNICIIIICLLLFIIIYLLCNNKCIYKPIKKIYGGEENNIENINQEIKQEQEKIDTISNELESNKFSRSSLLQRSISLNIYLLLMSLLEKTESSFFNLSSLSFGS